MTRAITGRPGTQDWVSRKRPRVTGVGGSLLALLLLSGCAPAGTMAAAQALTALLGSGQEKAIRPGTGIQNGHYRDESIGQALAAAQNEPLAICQARLREERSLPPGSCGLANLCLPGATAPTQLYVCTPDEESAGDPDSSASTGGLQVQ